MYLHRQVQKKKIQVIFRLQLQVGHVHYVFAIWLRGFKGRKKYSVLIYPAK